MSAYAHAGGTGSPKDPRENSQSTDRAGGDGMNRSLNTVMARLQQVI
jgi:hypothetical protein